MIIYVYYVRIEECDMASKRYRLTVVATDGKESRPSTVVVHRGVEKFAHGFVFGDNVDFIRLESSDSSVYEISESAISLV